MRMMKRPKRFEDPEDKVLEKITRGLTQFEPQPSPKVPRQSVVVPRQPPAQNPYLPLPRIEEAPTNPNTGYYQNISPNHQPQQVGQGILVGEQPLFNNESYNISSTELQFPQTIDLGTLGGEYRDLALIEPRSPELAPITEALLPMSPGPGVIQQPRTPQTSLIFGNMSIRSPDPQPSVTHHSPGSQGYLSSSSHNYHGGYGSSNFTNTESYQAQNNGFREVPDDILTVIAGGGDIFNGLLSTDGHENSREGMVVADGVTKKKSSKSGRKESKSDKDESKSIRKESKSERKEMRRKVKEKREKEDVTRAMNQLKL